MGDRVAKNPIVAAGGVVAKTLPDDSKEVILVFRAGHNDWSLPKGKLDSGESEVDCAVREVTEETGVEVEATTRLDSVHYLLPNGTEKTVHFWLMNARGSPPERLETNDPSEVSRVEWIPLDRAINLVTYQSDRGVLKQAKELLS